MSPQECSVDTPKTRNRVTFHASDIEGMRALLIIEHHGDGSTSSVKLLASELEEAAGIPLQ